MHSLNERDVSMQSHWSAQIPVEEWEVYDRVIGAALGRGLRFALGGAFAVAAYTGHWRNTKDLDLYVLPQDRDAMVAVLKDSGLQDYYSTLPYDPGWIYRSHTGYIIVDAIWAMANRRAQVDEAWLTRGPEVELRGRRVRVVPAEEMVWGKIYILQRGRCDWPDVLNLIYSTGERLDWEHLLARPAQDAALLRGVLSVFTWLCPGRAQALPAWLWGRLGLPAPPADRAAPDIDRERVRLIDSRPWFALGDLPDDSSNSGAAPGGGHAV